MKTRYKLLAILATALLQFCCEAEDPFVDREVAPVLVLLAGDDGVSSDGLTTEPSVSSAAAKAAKFSVKLYELDKNGILDKNTGIDSVAASGVSLKINIRGGGEVKTTPTNGSGIAAFEIPWADLGIAAPKSGNAVSLNCTGVYKEQSFTKLFRLTVK